MGQMAQLVLEFEAWEEVLETVEIVDLVDPLEVFMFSSKEQRLFLAKSPVKSSRNFFSTTGPNSSNIVVMSWAEAAFLKTGRGGRSRSMDSVETCSRVVGREDLPVGAILISGRLV